jgi:hypothetical protein
MTLSHQGPDYLLSAIVAGSIVSIPKEVEIDAHAFEDLVKMLVVSGDECFGSDPLSLGIDHYGSSMGIRTAYE